jgi:hypothetical protein
MSCFTTLVRFPEVLPCGKGICVTDYEVCRNPAAAAAPDADAVLADAAVNVVAAVVAAVTDPAQPAAGEWGV